jgi:FkbM family methyltransferase
VNELAHNGLADDPDFAASAPGRTLARTPLGFVDVGARGGVHPLVEPLARHTAVLGFEPAADECARLRTEIAKGSPWACCEIEPQALGAHRGTAELHVLTAPTNSSLLPPNAAFTERYGMAKWRVLSREPLETTTLDQILFEERAEETFWGELLKLDTQGTEYEILEGARRTLRERTVAVVSEVSFCELYRGQRLFSEVELLLRELGFSFYGFSTLHHRSQRMLDKRRAAGRERLMYADAVFLRDPLPGGPASALPIDERRLHTLFTSALLLGYGDFALELACSTFADGAERARIESLVRRTSAHEPAAARDAALALADDVRTAPELANVAVGRFVDARRWCWDYDDVAAGLGVGNA